MMITILLKCLTSTFCDDRRGCLADRLNTHRARGGGGWRSLARCRVVHRPATGGARCGHFNFASISRTEAVPEIPLRFYACFVGSEHVDNIVTLGGTARPTQGRRRCATGSAACAAPAPRPSSRTRANNFMIRTGNWLRFPYDSTHFIVGSSVVFLRVSLYVSLRLIGGRPCTNVQVLCFRARGLHLQKRGPMKTKTKKTTKTSGVLH
eukprot:SAG25_NODE_2514_length_1557_cov_3.554952_1_plen_208_part_00